MASPHSTPLAVPAQTLVRDSLHDNIYSYDAHLRPTRKASHRSTNTDVVHSNWLMFLQYSEEVEGRIDDLRETCPSVEVVAVPFKAALAFERSRSVHSEMITTLFMQFLFMIDTLASYMAKSDDMLIHESPHLEAQLRLMAHAISDGVQIVNEYRDRSFVRGITGKHVWDTHFAAVGNVCMQLAHELEQLPALSGVLDHSDLFTEWRTSANLLADQLWSRLDQQTFVSGREYFLSPGHQRYVPNRRSQDKGHYVNMKTGVSNSEMDHRLASLRQRFQDQVDERLDTCMNQLKELYLIYEKHLHAAGDNHVPPPRTSYVDPEHSLQPKPRGRINFRKLWKSAISQPFKRSSQSIDETSYPMPVATYSFSDASSMLPQDDGTPNNAALTGVIDSPSPWLEEQKLPNPPIPSIAYVIDQPPAYVEDTSLSFAHFFRGGTTTDPNPSPDMDFDFDTEDTRSVDQPSSIFDGNEAWAVASGTAVTTIDVPTVRRDALPLYAVNEEDEARPLLDAKTSISLREELGFESDKTAVLPNLDVEDVEDTGRMKSSLSDVVESEREEPAGLDSAVLETESDASVTATTLCGSQGSCELASQNLAISGVKGDTCATSETSRGSHDAGAPAPATTIDVVDILNTDRESRDGLLTLRGDEATRRLEELQSWLDCNSTHHHRSRAIRLLVDLGTQSEQVPPSLFISDVTLSPSSDVYPGGFADVYQGQHSGQKVAIKRLRQYPRTRDKLHRDFCKEGLVWRQLNHPHILPFLGVDRTTFEDSLCMVSPWMERGTLMDFIVSDEYRVVDDRQRLISEVASGLEYLHAQQLAHGDLHGSNVFIDAFGRVRLADFGLTVLLDLSRAQTYEEAGSVQWVPPEAFVFEGERPKRTMEGDVFAFGRVAYAVCARRMPFGSMPALAVMYRVCTHAHPSRPTSEECSDLPMSESLWDMVQQCWAAESAERPRIADVCTQLACFPG